MTQQFAPMAKGFRPTGKYFLILSGRHQSEVGEAYKFLTWGGVAIRVHDTPEKELCVCAMESVMEITFEDYQTLIKGEEDVD